MSLDSLPALPDITGKSSYTSTPAPSGSGSVFDDPAGKDNATLGQKIFGLPSVGKGSFGVQSIVFVVLGLLFVAGGIFAFREVRQVVSSGVKTGTKVAAMVA